MEKEDLIVSSSKANEILQKAKDKWYYDQHKCWFPLRPTGQLIKHKGKWVVVDNDEPKPDFDWFFIREQFMKEQYHRILDLLFKGKVEAIYFIPLVEEELYLFERHEFEKYKDDFAEYTCSPESVSWIYYKGHEGTVSFAGTIYNEAKRILACEIVHWDEY